MDELKNLMIQTLEANGILGQLRAQIRCSVFKIIDNQDDMENPQNRGKSALHWENQRAREVLKTSGATSLLLAELIREYLEFYSLDYTKQIFMPESSLMTVEQRSKEQIADKANLQDVNEKKPLLLQILERYLQGVDSYQTTRNNNNNSNSNNMMLEKEQQQNLTDAKASSMKPKNNMSSSASPDQHSDAFNAVKSSAAKGSAGAGGIQFSDEKNDDHDGGLDQPAAMGIGDGIVSGQKPKSSNKTDKHIDKANSLLDELSREEKSGFKAEIGSGSDKIMASDSKTDEKQQLESSKQGKFSSGAAAAQDQQKDDKLLKKKSSPEMEEYYGDEFDEIDEDLPQQDDELDNSGEGIRPSKIGESHGITVSQSLGIDPSVDSLALEDYDHIEAVDKVNPGGPI